MAKPILLSVDDDSDVLRAIERDLRSKYGAEYRVIGSDSPEGALALLKQLKLRNDSVVSLLLSGLAACRTWMAASVSAGSDEIIFPEAKRALLTAYADTNAAISAINDANINYFFLKPWDPPSEHLYPQLDDLLDDWQASYRPAFEGIRVLGTRWSPRSYELRDFLARNRVPYQWIDVEASANDPETKRLLDVLGPEASNIPVVLFPDGTKLPGRRSRGCGSKGWIADSRSDEFLRSGDHWWRACRPGGRRLWRVRGSAHGDDRARGAGRAGGNEFSHRKLSWISDGAQRRRSGAAGGSSQAQRFKVEILAPQEAVAVRTEGSYRIIKMADGSEISCHALMIATGVQWRQLEAPGIERLQGAGVYYGGGSTEAMSCKGEIIYIVGGANSAGQAAMNFAKYADRVVIVVRGSSLSSTMSQYLIDQIKERPNIQLWPHASVSEVPHGDTHLEEILVSLFGYQQDRSRAGEFDVHLYRSVAADRLARGFGRTRRPRLYSHGTRSCARRRAA